MHISLLFKVSSTLPQIRLFILYIPLIGIGFGHTTRQGEIEFADLGDRIRR